MKDFLESKKGLFFCALFFTGFCMLYVMTVARKGLYAALQFPSPMANIIFFSGSAALAVICWYRCLNYKPDREELRHKKSVPLWTGMTVLCLLLAVIFLLLFWYLGRSAPALALCVLMLACAVVSAVRAVRSKEKK